MDKITDIHSISPQGREIKPWLAKQQQNSYERLNTASDPVCKNTQIRDWITQHSASESAFPVLIGILN